MLCIMPLIICITFEVASSATIARRLSLRKSCSLSPSFPTVPRAYSLLRIISWSHLHLSHLEAVLAPNGNISKVHARTYVCM